MNRLSERYIEDLYECRCDERLWKSENLKWRDLHVSHTLGDTGDWNKYNTRPLVILESTQVRTDSKMISGLTGILYTVHNSLNSHLLETVQSEKYNTKHIQTRPFSDTLLNTGTLSDLECQLLFNLTTSHGPSISPEIRSGHNHNYHVPVRIIRKERIT